MREKNYFLLIVLDELYAIKEIIKENKLLTLIVIISCFLALYLIDPLPSKKIDIAVSGEDSGYALMVKKQQAYLSNNGVVLNIKASQSSVQSAKLLANTSSGVTAALIQGGVLDNELADSIYSLGSVSYEPVWIFYRKILGKKPTHLKDLANYRIGVGPKESGTWLIAKQLFALNKVDIQVNKNFIADSSEKNLEDFLAGKLDVVINVNPQIDPVVARLLREPTADIFEISHAVAYDKNLPFVRVLTLPAFSIDIAEQIPPKDIALLATTTTLAVSKEMHPSLQMLLLMSVKDSQRDSKNIFQGDDERFPLYMDPTIHISPAASQYYDYGVPQVMRFLPFGLAGFIDRTWVFLLAIIAVILPLSNLNINLRTIRFNAKLAIYRRRLLGIKTQLHDATVSKDQYPDISRQLQIMRQKIMAIRVPVDCEQDFLGLLDLIEELCQKIE